MLYKTEKVAEEEIELAHIAEKLGLDVDVWIGKEFRI